MAVEQGGSGVRGRIWRFGAFTLEEISRRLAKDGQEVEVRGKPLDLLICLLGAKTATVTKEQLIERVWLGEFVEPSVIKVTVGSLRKALGDHDQTLILNVFKVGYRMGVPVTCVEVDEVVVPRFQLATGAAVPDKPTWHLDYFLDQTAPHWVWTARQDTKSLVRVFKFAEDGVRYSALQREITLSRLFERAAPKATCFVKVYDWRLDAAPYYLEAEFGGINLLEWATKLRNPESGGLPRALCLKVMAELCDAVDIAHEIGVFHNDLKPSNILLSQEGGDEAWHVKVADFGIATLLSPERLAEYDITNHGFGDDPGATAVGSAMYHAPEVKPGQPSTRSADIYALGVILYQLLSGDFSKTPTPGWQKDIDDDLLQRDIEQAVDRDPALRLKSASELAERLRTLDGRRTEEAARAERHRRAEAALAQAERNRARRPFLVAILAALLVGLGGSLWFYTKASRERETTAQINEFLTADLLRQSNPNVGRGVDETLKQAIEDVIPAVDARFPGKPEVAAGVHYTIARALDNGNDYDVAAHEYDAAAADWIKADGPLSQDAIFVQMQHVFLYGRSQRSGSLEKAKALYAQEKPLMDRIPRPQPRVVFSNLEAAGIVALASGDAQGAETNFARAVEVASGSKTVPEDFLLSGRQRLCSVQMRAGDVVNAEKCFRTLKTEIAASKGEGDPNLVLFDLNIAQSQLLQGRFEDAIQQVNAVYPNFVKQMGSDNQLTLDLLGVRAQAEGELDRWDDSIRDDLAVGEIARKTDPHGYMAVGSLTDAALSECRAGRYEAGERDAREGLKMASGPDQNPGMKGVAEYSLMVCILLPQLTGKVTPVRLVEAERLLDDIDVRAMSTITADPGWEANADLARAQLAFARKNYAEASKYLGEAKPGFDSPKAERYQRQSMARLEDALRSALK